MKPYYETELGVLYHGDCLQIMPHLEPVDLVLCDLPYGTTANKWDVVIPFDDLWSCYNQAIENSGAIVLTACQPFTSKLVMSNIEMFKYEWIWEKTRHSNFLLVKTQPMRKHENILVFYNHSPFYNPQMEHGKPYSDNRIEKTRDFNTTGTELINTKRKNTGVRFPSSVQVFPNSNHKNLHPTQKPEQLFMYLINTYTQEKWTVLDNCIGSGTTAVACERLNRRWIGIEIEEKYCEISAKRIENERKQLKLFN